MRSRNSGVTLLEVLVTGTLFAVVLSMIAQAMVVGFRAQTNISEKVHVHRAASLALDSIVRDAELAGITSRTYLQVAGAPQAIPDPAVTITSANELRIDIRQQGATIYDDPVSISVGYWYRSSDNTLRRTLYDAGGTVLAGTDPNGKTVATEVTDFKVGLVPDATTGLAALSATLALSNLEQDITTQMTLEVP